MARYSFAKILNCCCGNNDVSIWPPTTLELRLFRKCVWWPQIVCLSNVCHLTTDKQDIDCGAKITLVYSIDLNLQFSHNSSLNFAFRAAIWSCGDLDGSLNKSNATC